MSPMRILLDTPAVISFPDGSTYTITVSVEDYEPLEDNHFCIEMQFQDFRTRKRICLEDEVRSGHAFLYSAGAWKVERPWDGTEQGMVTPVLLPNKVTYATTSPPIELVLSDPDEWVGHDPLWNDVWLTLYFTLPTAAVPSFVLNETNQSTNAFPMQFALAPGAPPEGEKKLTRKKIRIIWQ